MQIISRRPEHKTNNQLRPSIKPQIHALDKPTNTVPALRKDEWELFWGSARAPPE